MAEAPMTDEQDLGSPSLAELVRKALDLVPRLIRDEVQLLKLELTGKLKSAGVGVGILVAAALFFLFTIGVLIAAAVLGLATALPAWLAALIVAASLLLLSALFALLGVRQLKKGGPPMPSDTIDSIKADVRAVKGE